MPTSKVTRKGQITVPQEIREALGIREGDTVQLVREDDHVILRRIVPWMELAGSLRHLAHVIPEDESELRETITDAWVAEAVERLDLEDTPGTGGSSEDGIAPQ